MLFLNCTSSHNANILEQWKEGNVSDFLKDMVESTKSRCVLLELPGDNCCLLTGNELPVAVLCILHHSFIPMPPPDPFLNCRSLLGIGTLTAGDSHLWGELFSIWLIKDLLFSVFSTNIFWTKLVSLVEVQRYYNEEG